MKKLFGIVLIMVLMLPAYSQERARPTQPNLKGDLLLDYGFSWWMYRVEELPIRAWGSNMVGVYYNRRFEINDHLSFNVAPGFSFEKYAFDRNQTWLRDGNSISLDSISGVTLDRNKLVVTYLDLPVEFRFHPMGTTDGEGWFVGVGALAGVRLGSHTKIRYFRNGDRIQERLYNDLGVSGYRVGAQARFGFKNIHLFYKMYFNDLFNNPPGDGDKNPRAMTIGLSVSGF